jgi:hypothetical protein
MTIKTVQIRLVADSEADVAAAIAALRDAIGTARVALSSPRAGRKGGYLAYGTLQIEDAAPPTASAPHAATGKTTRLRKL